jgi:hypothetical protein
MYGLAMRLFPLPRTTSRNFSDNAVTRQLRSCSYFFLTFPTFSNRVSEILLLEL